MAVRVKICGITSVDDARMVADAGADAIGLNFVAGPRKIDLELAEQILCRLPPWTTAVALAEVGRGEVSDEVLEVLAPHWVSHIQLYGAVTPETIMGLRVDGLKPIYVAHVGGADFCVEIQKVLDCCADHGPAAVLLDAHDARRLGGTGRPVDWDLIRQVGESGVMDDWPPLILAGGLTPENVSEAISVTKPWGVDVASGVESSPGRKDAGLVEAFIRAVRSAG